MPSIMGAATVVSTITTTETIYCCGVKIAAPYKIELITSPTSPRATIDAPKRAAAQLLA